MQIFQLTEKEERDANAFREEHNKVCVRKKGDLPTLGEHYYYKFIPNGLGHCVDIGCLYCKDAVKDITDVDSW